MTIQKPLVWTNDGIRQIPSGDTLVGFVEHAISVTKLVGNSETEVTGFVASVGVLSVGTVIRFIASGIQSNATQASTSIHRLRIGPTTLTGPIVASWSCVMGATARTNVPFYILGQILILSSTTAIGTLTVLDNSTTRYALPTTTVTAPVTIATNADQRVQLTTISGHNNTSWNYFVATSEIVKS